MKAAKDAPCLCALRFFFVEHFLLTRNSLGLTQMEFALELGIDRRSYLNIEHRKNLYCAVTLLACLRYFCDDPLGTLYSRTVSMRASSDPVDRQNLSPKFTSLFAIGNSV